MCREGASEQSCLLAHLGISVLHQGRCDGNEVAIDHLVSRFLMVDKLIQSFQSITAFRSVEVLLEEDLLELLDGSVEDGDSDLIGLDFRGEFFLEVWVPCLQ